MHCMLLRWRNMHFIVSNIQHVSRITIMAFMKETMLKTHSGMVKTMVETRMRENSCVVTLCHSFNIQHSPICSQGYPQLFHLQQLRRQHRFSHLNLIKVVRMVQNQQKTGHEACRVYWSVMTVGKATP